MSWQEVFVSRFAPGAFSGITPGLWFRVLRENRFDVDRPYWGRAALITAGSFMNAVFAHWENLRYARRIRATTVDPPLFVLGLWRSGTTHLHNLLAHDSRFAYPTFYDVLYPQTFLSTERTSAYLVGRCLPQTRPQDNMKMGVREPQEDEFALCALTPYAYLTVLGFPRRMHHYERFLTLRDVAPRELTQWKSALMWFIKKLAFKYQRPLVLKSPGHTCRVKVLLEMFPDAKFVYIHRHPYDVFRSVVHSALKLAPYSTLQRTDHRDLEDQIIRLYRTVNETYLNQRDAIPRKRLHEMAFESLEADPVGEVRGIYRALDLPDFGHVEPRLKTYVESISGYRRNSFAELSADQRTRIRDQWRRTFEQWGYRG